MMDRIKRVIAIALLLSPILSFAKPYYGANLSVATVTKEPPNLHGVQVMFNYDPERYQWRKFNVYFDAGFSHFWITHTHHNTVLNIYSSAPVIRYTFKRHGYFHPYLELSIGIAYLNHTHIDSRNLGIHFAFQDRFGIGTFIGSSEHLTAGLHAVHYSNAHFAGCNSGVTIPIALDVGYRFD